MHVTPNGRGPRPPSLAATAKAAQRLTEHVDRKLSDITIPPASTGGSIAQAGAAPAVSVFIGTAGSLAVTGWTFYAGSDGKTLPLVAPESWWSPASFGVTEDGWYEANILVSIGWTAGAAPKSVRVQAGRASQGYTSANFQYQIPTLPGDAPGLHEAGVTGAYVTLTVPKQYYVAADHAFSALVSWPNTATPTAANGSGAPFYGVVFTRCG